MSPISSSSSSLTYSLSLSNTLSPFSLNINNDRSHSGLDRVGAVCIRGPRWRSTEQPRGARVWPRDYWAHAQLFILSFWTHHFKEL
jgi:hypothetical protein